MFILLYPLANIGFDNFDIRVEPMNFCLRNFLARQSGVDIKVIFVEQILDPSLESFQSKLQVPDGLNHEFIIVRNREFNKHWLHNIGVKAGTAPRFILADCDIYTNKDFLKDAVEFGEVVDAKWFFCWEEVCYMKEEATRRLMEHDLSDRYSPSNGLSTSLRGRLDSSHTACSRAP